jgi:hypothetical protein
MGDFVAMNEVYAEYFAEGDPPARSTVAVAGLPRGALVEMECIALTPDGRRQMDDEENRHATRRAQWRTDQEDLED